MSVYQFYNPAPVFFDLLGIQPVAGGSLYFYEIGTTTPKDTWSDVDMTTLNVNPIPLDASGRSSLNIFMDGDYTVICTDSLGATIWTRDIPASAAAGELATQSGLTGWAQGEATKAAVTCFKA